MIIGHRQSWALTRHFCWARPVSSSADERCLGLSDAPVFGCSADGELWRIPPLLVIGNAMQLLVYHRCL